jgi:hypothetical protein
LGGCYFCDGKAAPGNPAEVDIADDYPFGDEELIDILTERLSNYL